MDTLKIEPLKRYHINDFMDWGKHKNPLNSMYNFEEGLDSLDSWYRWKTKSNKDHYFAVLYGGKAVGYVGLRGVSTLFGKGELGIILDSNYMDLGIGTHAIEWILDYGFHELGLSQIELYALPWNKRALHVYEKMGFFYKGRKWQEVYFDAEDRVVEAALTPYMEDVKYLGPRYLIRMYRMIKLKG